jgi:uncharacterized membrane protein YdjX (TVP38/TMEM64 family)
VKPYGKPLILLLILSLGIGVYFSGAKTYLRLDYIQMQLYTLEEIFHKNPFKVVMLFSFLYVLMTSLSIPGAIVLTILSGALFGVVYGTLLSGLASSVGASIAFILSRYFFKEFVAKTFSQQHEKVAKKFLKQGASYLFTLRLFPASPFVVINLLMGLTNMKLFTFGWITFLGMLPGTFIYVYAGRKLAEIEKVSDIMSPSIILTLIGLSFLPYLLKAFLKRLEQRGLA